MDYRGKWALVTGASAGIGEIFAKTLAQKGANVVLVARRGERLRNLASAIEAAHGVRAIAVVADLSRPEAPEEVQTAAIANNCEIDILINNAGFGLPGSFEETSWAEHRDFIELMVTSYAHLVRLFLPAMQARARGRIVNVASLAGLTPSAAGHTLYGASKAFLISFSEALAAENADKGVNVCALCPGFTYSEFHDVNNMREVVNKLPKYMFMDAQSVVHAALDALETGRVICVPGLWNKFVYALMGALPRSLAARIVARQAHRFRRASGA
jgi:short-subunit dehydrogenase